MFKKILIEDSISTEKGIKGIGKEFIHLHIADIDYNLLLDKEQAEELVRQINAAIEEDK